MCSGMESPQKLTDRAALKRFRDRARRTGADGLIMQELVASEIDVRLSEVNRTFPKIAIVTGFPNFWAARYPEATIVPDEEVLALEVGAFDLVLSLMCLHWSDDPVGHLVQCRRALKEDGLFLAATLGGQTLHELRAVLAQAETIHMGGLSPRVLPMAEIRDLGGLLQRAGLALPVADNILRRFTYEDFGALVRDLRAMGETNAIANRHKATPPRALFGEAASIYHAEFVQPDGRIPATFDTIWLTGWAPSDQQPKPLRPGSAQQRLADALGVNEISTGESAKRT